MLGMLAVAFEKGSSRPLAAPGSDVGCLSRVRRARKAVPSRGMMLGMLGMMRFGVLQNAAFFFPHEQCGSEVGFGVETGAGTPRPLSHEPPLTCHAPLSRFWKGSHL